MRWRLLLRQKGTGEEVATTKARIFKYGALKRVRLNVDSLKFIGQTLEQVIIEASNKTVTGCSDLRILSLRAIDRLFQ